MAILTDLLMRIGYLWDAHRKKVYLHIEFGSFMIPLANGSILSTS
jgi:hypothetical protein